VFELARDSPQNHVLADKRVRRRGANGAHQKAVQKSDRQNARIEHDAALRRMIGALLADHAELFKQYSDNDGFRRWLEDTMFGATYQPPA
jgi:type I restriction enzyme R subunit